MTNISRHARHSTLPRASLLLLLLQSLHHASANEASRVPPSLLQLDGIMQQRRSELESILSSCHSSDGTQRIVSTKLIRQLDRLKRVLSSSLAQLDEQGLSRLHHAVIERDTARLEYLLQAGMDHEAAVGELAVRPLHLSVLSGDEAPECLEALLHAGADPDATDARGTTPLIAAAALNLPYCTARLLHHGASPDKAGADGVRALHMTGATNAAEAAQVLLKNGAMVGVRDEGGRSALHAAAAHDASEVLEEVVDAGADIEWSDGDGRRPIHFAVSACSCSDPKCPRTRALSFLLQMGASVDAEDHEGWRPLHIAAERNRLAAVNMLLAAGVDPNACGPNGTPPLTVAAYGGADATVERLLLAGAAHDAPDTHGGTPLHAAAAGGNKRALKLLLRVGALPDTIDDVGRNAVHYAASGGCSKCIRALRKASANLELANDFGWTPLHVASNFSQVTAVEALLKAGVQPSPCDHANWTPLHVAAHRLADDVGGCRCRSCSELHERKLQSMCALLRNGAAPNIADNRGTTAAHILAARDCAEGLRLLRGAKGDLWVADGRGRTPLRLARQGRRCSHAARTILFMEGAFDGNRATTSTKTS